MKKRISPIGCTVAVLILCLVIPDPFPLIDEVLFPLVTCIITTAISNGRKAIGTDN